MKHTNGPWFVQPKSDVYTNIIRPESNYGSIIASCPQSSTDETKANARLIAAAPDLLNALEQMMISLNKSSCGWNMDSDIERAYSLCKEAYLKSKGQ
jgi:hypothetical protein